MHMAQRHLNSSSMSTLIDGREDPLQVLPYEVWLLCIRFAISDTADGPLPFMSISRQWDQAILEEPELWTTIVIDGNEDEAARLYTFLELSRGRHLNLIFLCTSDIADSMQILMSHAQRICSMTIADDESFQDGEKSIIQWFAEEASHYPSMTDLEFPSWTLDEWTQLVSMFPNLQAISGDDLTIDEVPSTKFQRINNIRVDTLEDALALIQSPNLRSAHITYPEPWTDLSDEDWVLHANHLNQGSYGQLRSLSIRLELLKIEILLQLLPKLPLLHSFHLHLTNSLVIPPAWAPQPFLAEDIRHIKTRGIAWTSRGLHGTIVEAMVQMFTTHDSLFHVEDLNWETYVGVYRSLVYSLLRGLTKVRRLHLALMLIEDRPDDDSDDDDGDDYNDDGDNEDDDNDNDDDNGDRNGDDDPCSRKPLIFNYVHSLSLSPSCLFDYIEAPNAITLYLCHGDNDAMTNRKPPPSISRLCMDTEELDHVVSNLSAPLIESEWQELQTLQLEGTEWLTTATYMRSLTTVDFSKGIPKDLEWLDNYWTIDNFGLIDTFILELLRNPKALPNLHTITSWEYPMWEPLFELLRRRNRDSHSIKRLTGTIYPAPAILSRLVMLLQGQQDVYTQRDVDDVIYRRFGDRSTGFSACVICAYAGYTSCPSDELEEVTLEIVDADLLDLWGHEPNTRYQICDSEKWNQLMNGDKLRETKDSLYDGGLAVDDCRKRNPRDVNITGSILVDVAPPWHGSRLT